MRDLAGARAEDVQFLIVAGSGCEVAGLVLFLMGHADLWHASPLSFVIYVNITDKSRPGAETRGRPVRRGVERQPAVHSKLPMSLYSSVVQIAINQKNAALPAGSLEGGKVGTDGVPAST